MVFFVGFLTIPLEYLVLPDARGPAESPQQCSTVPTFLCKGQSWHLALLLLFNISPHLCLLCKIQEYVPSSPSLQIRTSHGNASCHLKLMRKADLGHWGNLVLTPSCSEDALHSAGAVCLCSCWPCWTVGWKTGVERLNFTPTDRKEREKNVKEGVIGTRWSPGSELGSFAVSAPCCGGYCVSVLKLDTFQPPSCRGLHSSSLPGFLHCWDQEAWAGSVPGLAAAGRGAQPGPCPSPAELGSRALHQVCSSFTGLLEFLLLLWDALFSPSPDTACAGAVTSTSFNHHCTDGFAPL